jgi:hypothetical protein
MKYLIHRTSEKSPHDNAEKVELSYKKEEKLLKWDEEANKLRWNFVDIRSNYRRILDNFINSHSDVREDGNYYIGIIDEKIIFYTIEIENILDFIKELDERVIITYNGGDYGPSIRQYLEDNEI